MRLVISVGRDSARARAVMAGTTKAFWSDIVKQFLGKAVVVAGLASMALAAPAAAQYRNKIANEPASCRAGAGPAVNVRINGITPAHGVLRVQLYRGTASDWLQKGRWLNRIEVPANGASATVCMPVPGPGTYGIAVRHDVNGNGATDLRTDGGGMSNNPSISVLNLGKPSYDKTAFRVASDVKTITIQMRYF
jgi:uncharacterized protein (DUF2141 family)